MTDIFISHTEEDRELAVQLADSLEHEGYVTWYYERDSVPGPSYLIQVGREIEASQVLLLIASPSSLKSQHVTNEIIRAYEHGKHFVPLLFEVVHTDIQEQQPIWRQCLGSATAVGIDKSSLLSTTQKILDGLERICVKKSGARAARLGSGHKKGAEETPSKRHSYTSVGSAMSSIQFEDGTVAFRTERFELSQTKGQTGIIQLASISTATSRTNILGVSPK
jgi:hypothetical protein